MLWGSGPIHRIWKLCFCFTARIYSRLGSKVECPYHMVSSTRIEAMIPRGESSWTLRHRMEQKLQLFPVLWKMGLLRTTWSRRKHYDKRKRTAIWSLVILCIDWKDKVLKSTKALLRHRKFCDATISTFFTHLETRFLGFNALNDPLMTPVLISLSLSHLSFFS